MSSLKQMVEMLQNSIIYSDDHSLLAFLQFTEVQFVYIFAALKAFLIK